MPRKKKETLVHFDIDTLSKQTEQKQPEHPASLGQTLKAKREKKKLTLEDVSKKLFIKEIYLQALEDGHYYAFPSRVYGIGFLRTYAKFLGLDADLMVAEFHAETSDIKDAPLDMPVIEKHLALPSKRTLTIVSLCILVLVVVWFTVATLITTDIFKVAQPDQMPAPTQEEVVPQEEIPQIADESLNQETTKEQDTAIKAPQEQVKENKQPENTVNPLAFTAKAAFVATSEVWVRLYNTETQKVILDKVLKKNDSFIPESDLSVLELTTGRPKFLVLYKNGQKVKTFGQEKNLSLANFAEKQN